MANKEYKIMAKACADAGCYIPEECTFHMRVANTPAFIREYFYAKGKRDALVSGDEQ